MTKRTRYSAEFKRQAVELLENRDQPVTDLARELGIRQNQLYKWREEIKRKGDAAFKGSGRPRKDQMSELSRLKQENKNEGVGVGQVSGSDLHNCLMSLPSILIILCFQRL